MSSSRANSLGIVVLDSLYFVVAMALLSGLTASIAAGAEDLRQPAIDAAATQSDEGARPTGDPNESPAQARETNVLGMKLLEQRRGIVRVTDVAAASPAWDAGIRPGDQLTSIDGVKIDKLAPWARDMAKLLAKKDGGQSVAAEVVRDDAQLDLRIRLSESNAAAARDARKADEAMAKAAAAATRQREQQQLGPMPVAVGRPDGDPYYDRYPGYGGGLTGFFGSDDDGMTDDEDPNDDRMANRAIAHLSAVNTVAGGAAGQVGIAAFRTSGQGVATMVAVRGLPQGSYVVGIDDGSALAGGIGAGVGVGEDIGVDRDVNDPTRPMTDGQQNNARRGNLGERGDNGQNRNGFNRDGQLRNDPRMQNHQNQPNQQPAPNGQQLMPNGMPVPQPQIPVPGQQQIPASDTPTGGDGASLADPHGSSSYLAQQLDAPATQSGAPGPAAQPGAAPVQNRNIPAQNLPNQNVRSPANVDRGTRVNDADRRQNPRVGGQSGLPPEVIGYGGPGAPQFLREIGVLHVGPDGVGQLQNQLDGVEVRHLAGLHVTVASTMSRGGGGFGPSQQNPMQTGADPRVTQQSQNLPGRPTADPQTSNPRTSQQRAAASAAAANPGVQGAPGVVATGVIQLVEGRGGLGSDGAFGESMQGERPVDDATREQRERSQISDPREQFDGSNPQEQFEGSNPQEQFESSDLNRGNG